MRARARHRRPSVRELPGKARQAAYAASVAALKAGAQMVKLEGGAWLAPTVEFLVTRGESRSAATSACCRNRSTRSAAIASRAKTRTPRRCSPTDARALATRGRIAADRRMRAARSRRSAHARGRSPGRSASAPGPACSGQVLVIYDALGVQPGRPARFVRNFMPGHDSVEAALAAYVARRQGRIVSGAPSTASETGAARRDPAHSHR